MVVNGMAMSRLINGWYLLTVKVIEKETGKEEVIHNVCGLGHSWTPNDYVLSGKASPKNTMKLSIFGDKEVTVDMFKYSLKVCNEGCDDI